MVFQHLSGFTALRSAPRQNFWPRGAPRIFAQNGTSRAWRPRAERRSGAGSIGAAVRCRRLPDGENSGRLPAPRSILALNRRLTLYIREAKSPRPSPIHTPITHKQRTAGHGGRVLVRPPTIRRARAHSAGTQSERPHVKQHAAYSTHKKRFRLLPALHRTASNPCRRLPVRALFAAFQCVHYSAARRWLSAAGALLDAINAPLFAPGA